MRFRLVLPVLLVLVMFFGVAPFSTGTAAAQATCTQTHVVQPGQNLFRIGLQYGVRWDTLAAWNNLANANLVYVGQVLCVSGPWSGGYNPTTPPPASPLVVYPGNPFGPTTEPRIFFPQATLGVSFQLRGYNFPPNRQATIAIGTLGNAYIPHYTTTTDATGTFLVQVNLPDSLKSAGTVAVMVTTSGGYYAKNWYFNR